MLDTVEKRVTEHHVRAGHVDFGSEHLFAVSIFARFHVAENLKVLLYASVSVWTLDTRFVHSAASFADFFLSLVIYIGETSLDEFLSPFIKLVKIVGSIFLFVPLETEPLDVLLDGIYVFGVFLCWVCVIKTQVRLSSILLGKSEIDADTLSVSKMQVAVRLRRETREYAVDFPGFQV